MSRPKKDGGRRIIVDLDEYEWRLLQYLLLDIKAHAAAKQQPAPSLRAVLRGCIRTAIMQVYGDEDITDIVATSSVRKLYERMVAKRQDLSEKPKR